MKHIFFIVFWFLLLGSNLNAQSDSSIHVYSGYSMVGITGSNIPRGNAFHVGMEKNGYGFIASISYSQKYANISGHDVKFSTSSTSFQFLLHTIGPNYISFGPLISDNFYGVVTCGAMILKNRLFFTVGYSAYYGMHTGFMLAL